MIKTVTSLVGMCGLIGLIAAPSLAQDKMGGKMDGDKMGGKMAAKKPMHKMSRNKMMKKKM